MVTIREIRLRYIEDVFEEIYVKKEKMRKLLKLNVLSWENYFKKIVGIR